MSEGKVTELVGEEIIYYQLSWICPCGERNEYKVPALVPMTLHCEYCFQDTEADIGERHLCRTRREQMTDNKWASFQ